MKSAIKKSIIAGGYDINCTTNHILWSMVNIKFSKLITTTRSKNIYGKIG